VLEREDPGQDEPEQGHRHEKLDEREATRISERSDDGLHRRVTSMVTTADFVLLEAATPTPVIGL
jgi:hypothetical protein